jgi:hypothetical protein
MRAFKLHVESATERHTEIGLSYLKDGEWHEVGRTIIFPSGASVVPVGSTFVVYPEDFDVAE